MQMRTKRPGFTLIELMVAMALTLFIMTILSQAFVMSIETFSGMKGIGDMQMNLRTASILLRDDLIEDHFEGKRRLSDVVVVPTGKTAGVFNERPLQGFFAIRQINPPINEGNDASGMPSYRATDHLLYMTVKRKGNRTENFFSSALIGDATTLTRFFGQSTAYNITAANLPAATWASAYPTAPPYPPQGFYNSQWAEVLYYLVQTGTTEEPNNPASVNGTPTFGLFRAQFGMVPEKTTLKTAINAPPLLAAGLNLTTFVQMSCNAITANTYDFYTPTDAASGNRVVSNISALTIPPPARIQLASTLVLPNVTSFHIQAKLLITAATAPNFTDVALYDTTKFGTAGYIDNGLKGIQITLRVWDPKTRQTRQITVVQDL